jgi:hypothetical protein
VIPKNGEQSKCGLSLNGAAKDWNDDVKLRWQLSEK